MLRSEQALGSEDFLVGGCSLKCTLSPLSIFFTLKDEDLEGPDVGELSKLPDIP